MSSSSKSSFQLYAAGLAIGLDRSSYYTAYYSVVHLDKRWLVVIFGSLIFLDSNTQMLMYRNVNLPRSRSVKYHVTMVSKFISPFKTIKQSLQTAMVPNETTFV